MLRVYESAAAADRLHEAERFLVAQTAGVEARVVAATRGAADDFVRRLSLTRGSTFGLHRMSWSELVAHHAAPALAVSGKAVASRLGIEAVAARAVFQLRDEGRLDRFQEVSDHPGFARALASTVLDLRLAEVEAGRAGVELDSLRAAYEERLAEASLADWSELVATARAAVESDPHALLVDSPLLLLDVPVRTALERDLLGALAARATRVLVTLPAGDETTWERLRELGAKKTVQAGDATGGDLGRLRRYLFSDHAARRQQPDGSVEIFSAPGEGRECVEIARRVHQLAREGIAFDQMAVIVRSPDLYSSHMEAAFRRAGIPACFARGTKRPDPAGRAFLALLACRVERLSARRFAEYLSFAEVPDLGDDGAPPGAPAPWIGPSDESFGVASRLSQEARTTAQPQLAFDFVAPGTGDPNEGSADGTGRDESAPVTPDEGAEGVFSEDPDRPQIGGSLRAPWKWEEYLVEAAVIQGRSRWARRLRGFEQEMLLKLAELRSEEPESPRILRLTNDLRRLQHFERFALPVIDALDRLGKGTGSDGGAPWGAWIDDLEALAPRVLRDPTRVLEVLAEMRPMAEIGPVTIEEVRAVLAARLSDLERHPDADRFGKVFVGTPDHVRGRTFRVVFLPGLAERLFPQRPREDPLLLDVERKRIDPTLAVRETRASEERLLLRLGVGTAVDRLVVSWPRLDVAQARPRVPSFYALDIARGMLGVLPSHEELERRAVRARLAWPAPHHPGDAIDPLEHDLAVLGRLLHAPPGERTVGRARYLLELNGHLARSLRTRFARWARGRWSHWDGMVRTTEATAPLLARESLRERPYSVTALQKFAACPYQFFLSAIQRLEPRERVVHPIQMDPLTRGSLIHEAQARVLRRLRAEGQLPVRDASALLSTLDEVVLEVARRYEDDLAPPIQRVWQDEVAGIRADLRVWLHGLEESGTEWVPEHFEMAFGLPDAEEVDPASVDAPAVVAGGWKLRGAIDLVERSRDGKRLRVTDHKTGRDLSREIVYLGGGEILQPVLYSLAAETVLRAPVDHARLSFCTSRGGFATHAVPLDAFARHYAQKLFEAVDSSIVAGALPPAPRKEACAWCDFRPVCGQLEEMRQARKDRDLLEKLEEIREQP